MILRIRTLGEPVLREPAKPVTEFGPALRTLFEDMIETMVAAGVLDPEAARAVCDAAGISLRRGRASASWPALPER